MRWPDTWAQADPRPGRGTRRLGRGCAPAWSAVRPSAPNVPWRGEHAKCGGRPPNVSHSLGYAPLPAPVPRNAPHSRIQEFADSKLSYIAQNCGGRENPQVCSRCRSRTTCGRRDRARRATRSATGATGRRGRGDIIVARTAAPGVVTLNRPRALNALTTAMRAAIADGVPALGARSRRSMRWSSHSAIRPGLLRRRRRPRDGRLGQDPPGRRAPLAGRGVRAQLACSTASPSRPSR